MSAYEVGELLGHNPTTIQRWIKSFEAKGFSGLEDEERQGRPKRLTTEQLRRVDLSLRKSPRAFGYTQNLWDGKLLSHHIVQTEKTVLGARQCQRLFHQLKFRLRKPRPVIARADEEAQEAFKKTPHSGGKRRH